MTFIDVITHLFLPHESNNHKPRLLHPHAFLFYIVFLLFFGTGLRLANKYIPNILGVATNISVTDLLSLTNQKRTEAGLPALSLNNQLSQAAALKATDMFKDNYWAHFGPNGRSPWDFIIGSGYQYTFAGENLAKDFSDSQGVVSTWMSSPTHKANILKPEYKDIGFAVVNGSLNGQETTLVVQIFGSSPQSSTLAQNTQPEAFQTTEETPTVIPTPTIMVGTPTIFIAGVRSTPLISITSLNRAVSLLLLGLLTIVLTLDGFLIWQRKSIRVSGHNIAHIIFLAALFSVVWLTSRGSIL